jgi:type I restriction enzyme S subunit
MSQVELTTLGKSCEFFNGKAHEKSIDENGKYIVVNSKFISSEGKSFKRTNEQMFPLYKGDIVMVMSDVPNGKALAKCYIIDKDDTYSLNQRICCIRSKEFDTKYLYYQLNRHEHFLAFNNGENQTNLRKDDILACPLIKPSMEEQRRMVAELDEALSSLNQAKTNLQKNIENAKELFTTNKKQVFLKLVETEGKTPISYVCKEIFAGGDAPKDNFSSVKTKNNPIPIIANAVKDNGLYGFTNIARVIEPSITIAARGSGTGHTELRNEPFFPIVRLIVLTPKTDIISLEFLKFSIQNLIITSSGSAIPQLTIPMIKGYSISFPKSIEEQNKIVYQLEALERNTNLLKEKYQYKMEYIEELKVGIMKRAFEKELIEAE